MTNERAPQPHSFALPTSHSAWSALSELAGSSSPHLRDLFASDTDRASRMCIKAAGLTLDYSRQRVTPPVFAALLDLAQQCDVAGQRDAMFAGAPINATEDRAVLHVALRGSDAETAGAAPWDAKVSDFVRTELDRVCEFADAVRNGELRGYSGETITDIVNLGIGGSDLGPRMASEALAHLAGQRVRMHYVSNPDAWALHEVLRGLQPAHTLLIVSSKTFTTQETLTNAASAQRWLIDGGCPETRVGLHLAAVTASPKRTAELGYPAERTFLFRDWVGGRYSVWSALGLPLAIVIGAAAFRAFLRGAHAMDEHFRSAPPERNLPMLLALLGIWNRNFLKAPTQLLAPYASRLARFPAFIQQMDMESNGKHTHIDGTPCAIDTGSIVWGGLGIDGQHAYFQLVHQGRHLIPVDFIGVRTEDTPLPLAAEHHRVVCANLLAQARGLALGRDLEATRAQLLAAGLDAAEAGRLAPHRTFHGNVPSNVIWLEQLDAEALGALIALYEHKVFSQAAIWGIHAFDQWGVELGKQVVHEIYPALCGQPLPAGLDSATATSIGQLRDTGLDGGR